MKKHVLFAIATAALLPLLCCCNGGNNNEQTTDTTSGNEPAVVYLTRTITPESLVKIYEALNMTPEGNVAVKISTGEAGNNNYLKPELIAQLVQKVNGTIVECNTAYAGKRNTFADHWKTIKEHGFSNIAPVDLMDEEGDTIIPVTDTTLIKYNRVGKHLANYQFMINLAHFKGHPMAGFGGVIKNQSIGVSSANGKCYIHTAGYCDDATVLDSLWNHVAAQDDFCASMAVAAKSVHDYFGGRIAYINVMNNMSVDCDCISHPAETCLQDYGILASTDPVALDQACLDIIYNMPASENNNPAPLIERIKEKHGQYTVDYAEKIGLGSKKYKIVVID